MTLATNNSAKRQVSHKREDFLEEEGASWQELRETSSKGSSSHPHSLLLPPPSAPLGYCPSLPPQPGLATPPPSLQSPVMYFKSTNMS